MRADLQEKQGLRRRSQLWRHRSVGFCGSNARREGFLLVDASRTWFLFAPL